MNVECQCGAVRFTTKTPTPLGTFHCHCLNCRKQSSSAFGTTARFPVDSVFPLSTELQDQLTVFERRSEETGGTVECYFCKTCGSRLLHRTRLPNGTFKDSISVKGGCIEGLDWSKAVHIFTRSAVVPIPEGFERWESLPGQK